VRLSRRPASGDRISAGRDMLVIARKAAVAYRTHPCRRTSFSNCSSSPRRPRICEQVACFRAGLVLTQNRDDLLFREPLPSARTHKAMTGGGMCFDFEREEISDLTRKCQRKRSYLGLICTAAQIPCR
jgi:hypothetical protein